MKETALKQFAERVCVWRNSKAMQVGGYKGSNKIPMSLLQSPTGVIVRVMLMSTR